MINALKGRPLSFFCFSFVIFLCFSYRLRLKQDLIIGTYLIIATGVLAVLALAVKSKRFRALLLLIPITLGSTLGIFWGYSYSQNVLSRADDLYEKNVCVSARIEKVIYENEFSSAYKVRVTNIDGERSNITAMLKFPFGFQADEYDVLTFDAVFYAPSSDVEIGFNEKEYCVSNGMTAVCTGNENVRKISHTSSFLASISDLSRKISARFRIALGEYNGGFISALILGRRDNLPDRLSASFKYLGISHILSVSGLHLSIIVGTLYLLFSKTSIPLWVRFVISSAFTLFFVFLTGAGVAVVRAAIMLIFTSGAYLFGRKYDPLTALSFSALLIVLINPLAVFSPSFILSFSATLGIILLGIPSCSQISKAVHDKCSLIQTLGSIGMSVAITVSATLFTLPAVYHYFGTLSPISVLANLLFIPLCTVLMFTAIILAITYSTFIAPFAAIITSALSNLIDRLSYTISQASSDLLSLKYDFVIYLLIILFITFIILSCLNIKGVLSVLIMSAVFISGYSFGVFIYNDSSTVQTEIICINRSDNDYVLLHKNGSTLLCDMSNGSTSVLYDISDLGINYFHDECPDVILLTHLHRKHITMLVKFTDNYRPKKIILPSAKNDDEQRYVDSIIQLANEKNIAVQLYSPTTDESIDFNGCKITMFKQVMIKRSTQPINLICFKDRATLIYCSSAINETELIEYLPTLSIGECYLWFGTHGPIEKEELKLQFTPYYVFVSNDNMNSVYNTSYSVIRDYKYIALKRK